MPRIATARLTPSTAARRLPMPSGRAPLSALAIRSTGWLWSSDVLTLWEIDAEPTTTEVIRVTPISSAVEVAAVRRGLRIELACASRPGTPTEVAPAGRPCGWRRAPARVSAAALRRTRACPPSRPATRPLQADQQAAPLRRQAGTGGRGDAQGAGLRAHLHRRPAAGAPPAVTGRSLAEPGTHDAVDRHAHAEQHRQQDAAERQRRACPSAWTATSGRWRRRRRAR